MEKHIYLYLSLTQGRLVPIYLKKQIQFLACKATPYPSSLCFYRRDVTGCADEGIHAHAHVDINENANLHEYVCTVYMAAFLFL